MASDWIAYRRAHMPAPLLGEWGERWTTLFGAMQNDAQARQTDAALVKYPWTAPDDSVRMIAQDRRVLTSLLELPETLVPAGAWPVPLRGRLQKAFEYWGKSGKEIGIVDAFAAYSIPALVVEDQDVAGAFGSWNRFAVYADLDPFYALSGTTPQPVTWDDPSYPWDAGWRWDLGGFPAGLLADYMTGVIRLLKPADTRCIGLVISWNAGANVVIVPIDPTPIQPPLSPVGIMYGMLDFYMDSYLG